MDMKRFTEIGGREAIERLLNGVSIFNSWLQEYRIENDTLVRSFGGTENQISKLNVSEVLSKTWYVKKPFDVRAEMLARPNEWVGAFKNDTEDWIKVGFDSNAMSVVITLYSKHKVGPDARYCTVANSSILEKCIPIEDVPKGVSL